MPDPLDLFLAQLSRVGTDQRFLTFDQHRFESERYFWHAMIPWSEGERRRDWVSRFVDERYLKPEWLYVNLKICRNAYFFGLQKSRNGYIWLTRL